MLSLRAKGGILTATTILQDHERLVNVSKLLLSLLLFLVTVPSGWAQEITGEGVGPTKDQAKKEALADLSQNISVEVKSVQTQLSELMGQDFRQGATSLIQVVRNTLGNTRMTKQTGRGLGLIQMDKWKVVSGKMVSL